jgi:Ni,Fe-hydrogenase I large subunit
MSRGLLVHWVRLDGTGEAARTEAYRVLAPTEWNFHPRGVLARALAALHGAQAVDDAWRLAVAFDPCVAFTIIPPTTEASRHA